MAGKYNRTLHLPWSPGKGSDDKVATSVDCLLNVPLVITEKIDGSNTSLEADGCFARTHAHAPTHPSFDGLKALHATVKYLIPPNVQVFGEWCYARHSIAYHSLPGYFLMFGIRELREDNFTFWYSWGELVEWANELGVSTVPVLWKGTVSTAKELQDLVEDLAKQSSVYGDTCEGVVVRIEDVFNDNRFSQSVMKMVRKDHVSKENDHWMHQQVVPNKLKETS